MAQIGELQESFKIIESVYTLSGIKLHKTRKNYIKTRLIYLFNFISVNSELLGTVSWFLQGLRTGKDFVSLTFIAPCICYTSLANIKALLLYIDEKLMHTLIEHLNNLEHETRLRFDRSEREEIYGNDRRFLHTLLKVQNVMNIILFLGFVATPLSLIALKYYDTGMMELQLPLLALYPFDPFDIYVWPFIYAHQSWATVVVLVYMASADYFFYTCCTYITIQFKLLQKELVRVIPRTKDAFQMSSQSDKLKELLVWHQKIIHSAEILELIFAKQTLYNFISSSVVICCTLFNVTVIQDIAYVITFVFFLSMSLLQIFFLCYFGDMISKSSIDVSDAAYNSLWFLSNRSVGKDMLLIIMRSQKPCQLTAYKFAGVNLNSFMKILSNAWSYFALLKTIYH